jgi:hypothetical protein
MQIQRPQLERWEELALSGMIRALEDQRKISELQENKLPKHLEDLITRSMSKLIAREKRLAHLQEKMQES